MSGSIASHFVGWQGGILMSVIAFSIVFLVIAGLMLMMMALKVFVAAIDPNKSPTASTGGGTSAAPQPAKPSAAAAVQYEPPTQDDSELIAVFAAAIAASGGQAASVLSCTPVTPAAGRSAVSIWRMAGIFSNSRGLHD
jgi:hypothetical protein